MCLRRFGFLLRCPLALTPWGARDRAVPGSVGAPFAPSRGRQAGSGGPKLGGGSGAGREMIIKEIILLYLFPLFFSFPIYFFIVILLFLYFLAGWLDDRPKQAKSMQKQAESLQQGGGVD